MSDLKAVAAAECLELPWGYDGEDTVASQDWDGDGYSVFPVNKDGDCIGHIADVADEDKAAFIVRACNSYDALVKACKAALATHSLTDSEPGLPKLSEVEALLKAALKAARAA